MFLVQKVISIEMLLNKKWWKDWEKKVIILFSFFRRNFNEITRKKKGKHHYIKAKLLINKPGSLNPMFGKTHSEETKDLMRNKKVKYPNGVGIYDLDSNLIKSFDYASDLAIYLNVSKVTVSKYICNGLVYKDKYYLRVNPFNE